MGARWLGTDGRVRRGGQAAAWELTAETRAAALARTLTRQTLEAWGVADPVDVDDIVLMVDELITNAIVHGTGPARLRLILDRARVTGEVTDDSPAVPRDVGIDPHVPDWSEAGRGLLLVSALAAEFGARPAGCGKTVWFTRVLHAANGHTPTDITSAAAARAARAAAKDTTARTGRAGTPPGRGGASGEEGGGGDDAGGGRTEPGS